MDKTCKWFTVKNIFRLSVYVLCICAMQMNANAADGNVFVKNAFSNITDIIKSFVTCIGIILCLWGVFEWGNSMQGNDGVMQSGAFKRIGGGLVMCLAPQLLGVIIPTA